VTAEAVAAATLARGGWTVVLASEDIGDLQIVGRRGHGAPVRCEDDEPEPGVERLELVRTLEKTGIDIPAPGSPSGNRRAADTSAGSGHSGR